MPFENAYNILVDADFLLDPANTDKFTSAEQWEREVSNALTLIFRTKVGGVVFRSIRWHGRWVRISPVKKGIDDTDTSCRVDEALAVEQKDIDFYRSTKPLWESVGIGFKGFHGVVRFNPGQHSQGGNCARQFQSKGDFVPTPDSVLLHELVHAFRHVSKKFDNKTQTHGGIARHDSREEFNAILVQNLYQSELGTPIRRDHKGFQVLEDNLKGSFEFFMVSTKAFDLVDKFCTENKGLTGALAKLKLPFNPIAAYFSDRAKARSLSRSETAVRRDVGLLMSVSGTSWQTWLKILEAS